MDTPNGLELTKGVPDPLVLPNNDPRRVISGVLTTDPVAPCGNETSEMQIDHCEARECPLAVESAIQVPVDGEASYAMGIGVSETHVTPVVLPYSEATAQKSETTSEPISISEGENGQLLDLTPALNSPNEKMGSAVPLAPITGVPHVMLDANEVNTIIVQAATEERQDAEVDDVFLATPTEPLTPPRHQQYPETELSETMKDKGEILVASTIPDAVHQVVEAVVRSVMDTETGVDSLSLLGQDKIKLGASSKALPSQIQPGTLVETALPLLSQERDQPAPERKRRPSIVNVKEVNLKSFFGMGSQTSAIGPTNPKEELGGAPHESTITSGGGVVAAIRVSEFSQATDLPPSVAADQSKFFNVLSPSKLIPEPSEPNEEDQEDGDENEDEEEYEEKNIFETQILKGIFHPC